MSSAFRKLGLLALVAPVALAACQTVATGPAAMMSGAMAGWSSAAEKALDAIAGEVDEASLKADVYAMAAFGTRHTLSDQTSPTRGIGAAKRWVAAEFADISGTCGGCLVIEKPMQVMEAARLPGPTEIENVIAIQRGTTDPTRVIIISAHLDSRASNAMDATSDAPGANDDASGVAAVIEAARVLSKRKFPATIVYAALTGEEQSLLGGKVLAAYAKAQGWRVQAVLNNDIIGNSRGQGGRIDDATVRIFSEGGRASETPEMAAARNATGGELDSPARNLARYLAELAKRHVPDLEVRTIYRRDRFGRGGDQIPMLEAGFPAVRISEAAENYDRQHQDLRTENGVTYGDTPDAMDFAYLAKVTRLNLIGLAALASAPPPPSGVVAQGAVSADTKLRWTTVPGASGYGVWRRETTAPDWTLAASVGGEASEAVLANTIIDDAFFGVSARSPDGYESPVRFAGPVGAFFPEPPPAR